jgi:hypothetical protein
MGCKVFANWDYVLHSVMVLIVGSEIDSGWKIKRPS